jgi:peptidoglycan hydrolase CwlO-like protein
MKKLIFVLILASGAFFSQSCVKSCVCENPDSGNLTEIEISPTESCSEHSNSKIGDCI